MNEQRTPSILGRAPVILAVTAASYGLPPQARAQRTRAGTGQAGSARAGVAHARPARQRPQH
jgi:hypothetical protein